MSKMLQLFSPYFESYVKFLDIFKETSIFTHPWTV